MVQDECNTIGQLGLGKLVLTSPGLIPFPCKKLIHIHCGIYKDGRQGDTAKNVRT